MDNDQERVGSGNASDPETALSGGVGEADGTDEKPPEPASTQGAESTRAEAHSERESSAQTDAEERTQAGEEPSESPRAEQATAPVGDPWQSLSPGPGPGGPGTSQQGMYPGPQNWQYPWAPRPISPLHPYAWLRRPIPPLPSAPAWLPATVLVSGAAAALFVPPGHRAGLGLLVTGFVAALAVFPALRGRRSPWSVGYGILAGVLLSTVAVHDAP